MGLSLFVFVQWALKDASFLRNSAFWPFKVIQGRPRAMILVPFESAHNDFLLVTNSNYGPILYRFRDMATYWLKIAYFSHPPHSAPSLPKFPLEFHGAVYGEETRVMGLSFSEDRMILA